MKLTLNTLQYSTYYIPCAAWCNIKNDNDIVYSVLYLFLIVVRANSGLYPYTSLSGCLL
jgi:hypothetical protein